MLLNTSESIFLFRNTVLIISLNLFRFFVAALARVSWDSIVCNTTWYGLEGPGSESWWRQDFPYHP